jgi:Tfp pilus assembly protein PilO
LKIASKIQAFYAFLGRLSKREKAIFYSAAFFVSLVALDRLAISPVIAKIKSLDNEIQEKETAIKKNLRIVSQKDRIQDEASRYSSFLGGMKSEEEEMTSLLKEIETLANKGGVYLIDMKPAGLKDNRYAVNVSCEGQMEQLVSFMYNIENSAKLLMIDKYQITPKSRESSVAKASLLVSKLITPK